METRGVIKLKSGRAKPIRNRHPWIFSGAVASVQGSPRDGDIVDVLDKRGEFLARGYYNSQSQIRVRIVTWDAEQAVDGAFWAHRLDAAIERRQALDIQDTAYRLCHAESDLVPGLIVDRYADYLVVQFLTLGIERWKSEIVAALAEHWPCSGIYERSDVDVREKEGLAPTAGVLWGQMPPDRLQILEDDLAFWVDICGGQKTGFYLDQRENRQQVADYCPADAQVLNAFSYTGAQTAHLLRAGAALAVNVDASAEALEMARENMALNDLADREIEYVEGDVFQVLRRYRDQGRRFDLIVLDPPKFAYSRSQVQRACRGYKDINLLALQLLRDEGILATFSCSGLVDPDLFQKVIFGASVDAGRDAQILEKRSQGPDHPILLSFPEGEYLKGLICRVV
jgi:23S rRNA (cytosine1962-C5)-methyltransferase